MGSHKPTTRVNTLRVKCRTKPLALDVHNWLDETLCIQEDELLTVQMDGRQRCIFIKLTSMLHCEHIIRLTAGTAQIRTSTSESINVDIDIENDNLKTYDTRDSPCITVNHSHAEFATQQDACVPNAHLTAGRRSGHADLGADTRSLSTHRDICLQDRPN
ncbi:hypothetical protein PR048_009241 [Dryococelus australis]|uniref:Uncharacterized protein n=1 Tax=Dryococelus australis TaxID=614101 RepID=A0ABQ9HZE5_9NEOP|nr:hypothetical protein PR048_009241 [Dryococelus australis]